MKLIGIVIKEYEKLFEKQIFNFSDEYKIDYCFDNNKLYIDTKEEYIKGFYDEAIYNITPIVGINGVGKTTFLNFVYYYYPNGKESIKNSQFFRIYKEGEIFFIEENNITVSECNVPFEKDLSKKKTITIIKNCTISREYSVGSYGGTNAADIKFDREEFPSIFKSYEWLNKKGIISSKLILELSSFRYGFKEDYPDYSECSGLERLLYEILFNLLEESKNKGIIGEEVLSVIESRKLSYDEIFDELTLEDLKEFNNIFSSFKELIEKLLHLKKIGIIKESKEENKIYLISSASNLRDLEEFREKYFVVTELLRIAGIYRKIFHTIDLSMSKGERNLITTFAYINEAFERDSGEDWILVIDEIESGLHLEWSRQLIYKLVTFVIKQKSSNILKNLPTIQIIYTTHAPFMLSDIKQGNVIALKKEDGYSRIVDISSSFAKNILEIMHKEFFIKEIFGSFAKEKIDNIIKNLRSNTPEKNAISPKDMKVIIDSIGEPLLRGKLQKMYNKKYPNIEENKEVQSMIAKLRDLGYKVEKDE